MDVSLQRPPMPRPSLGIAIGLMVLGIALGILSFVMVTLPLLTLVKKAPSVTTPGSVTLQLNKGLYKVFEPTGTATAGSVPGSLPPGQTTIHATDVNVTGPAGGGIPVNDTDPSENITRGHGRYASAVAFRVSTPGIYMVRIAGAHGEALVVRSLADAVRSRVGWVAAIPIGGLCFLIGLVLLVVRIVRQSKAKSAAF